MLHPGLVVRINNEVAAAVSSENLNILSVRIHGDMISQEVAVLDVSGGYYGDPEEIRHLIWVHDRELLASDEVEIQFCGIAASSHAGRAIEEIDSGQGASVDGQSLDIAELAEYIRGQPRLRNGFDLHVQVSEVDRHIFSTNDQDYSFSVSIMWDWRSNDSAKLSVSGTTIQNIAEQKPGAQYLRGRLRNGQSVHVRVVSQ